MMTVDNLKVVKCAVNHLFNKYNNADIIYIGEIWNNNGEIRKISRFYTDLEDNIERLKKSTGLMSVDEILYNNENLLNPENIEYLLIKEIDSLSKSIVEDIDKTPSKKNSAISIYIDRNLEICTTNEYDAAE